MQIRFSFLLFILSTAGFGCTNSHIPIGDHDSGRSDGGNRDGGGALDAGAIDSGPRVVCGNTLCEVGDYCCNESCGICAPSDEPNAVCTQQACGPDDVVCDGQVCDSPTAQCCAGCDGLTFCSDGAGSCPPVDCPPPSGCQLDSECGPEGVCCPGCPGEANFCGMGGCPPVACPPPPTCGGEVCDANEVCCPGCQGGGVGCVPEGSACPDLLCQDCDPADAYGVGQCEPFRGAKFNGSYCEIVSGCECVGDDCNNLYPSLEECTAATSACPSTPGCEADLDCPDTHFCDSCGRGSCSVCLDCVADCTPLPCPSEPRATCRQQRPECGNDIAIVTNGCWQCVNRFTCAPIVQAPDCSMIDCADPNAVCTVCEVGQPPVCLPPGVACAL